MKFGGIAELFRISTNESSQLGQHRFRGNCCHDEFAPHYGRGMYLELDLPALAVRLLLLLAWGADYYLFFGSTMYTNVKVLSLVSIFEP